ncbi:MAG: hypothetical protein J6A59_12490, partial [Lachnospiraceae bacterium]|nr:hypothetical protein [Lachnospiraceae bacterium]
RVVYIHSMQDRYIIGVIYRVISEIYRKEFSTNCFSYKTSVCTGSAIEYIKNNIDINKSYGVKMDIHAYFNSVSEEKLKIMINSLFSDGFKITIEDIMLDHRVMVNGIEINEYKSLCPGCALGSFFANYTLRDIDNYFNNIPDVVYARYSDDIIILTDNKYKLDGYIKYVNDKITEYGLEMNPNKYKYFTLGDEVEYLGLKIRQDGKIDISDHAKQKMKKQIHRWCKKGRMEIERHSRDFDKIASKIIKRWNYKNFKCFVNNQSTFGWCVYAFRYITTIDTLRELDFYLKDTLRAMYTGKHNKANHYKLSDEQLMELGYISLVELYFLYKNNYNYYCEIVELL